MDSPSNEFQLIETIFHDLSEREPSRRAERIAYWKERAPQPLDRAIRLLEVSLGQTGFLESSPSLEAIEAFAEGERIDDFEIVRKMGEGSFGAVYLARQISLGRRVALKVSPDLGDEGRTMAPLEHENIVRVFSEKSLPGQGRRLLCMQYIPGVPLERVVQESRRRGHPLGGAEIETLLQSCVPTGEEPKERGSSLRQMDGDEFVLWTGALLCDALQYAHDRGVLHLDVKPANILLHQNGTPYLTDFNVSTRECESGRARVTGGTLRYMSPEQELRLTSQARERERLPPLTPGCDIYSLGIVLRELYWQRSGGEKGEMALLGEERDRILDRMAAPNRSIRFQSAREAGMALRACLERRLITKALPAKGPIRSLESRHPFLALLLLPILPQILGSIINISYNEIWIISSLDDLQRVWFGKLVLAYNLVVYPICFWLIIRSGQGLLTYLRTGGRRPVSDFSVLRQEVTNLPQRLLVVTTIGWMPGALFFPLGLALQGPVGWPLFAHFFASFSLSWLIATTYSFLYTQMFLLRNVYPRLLRNLFPIQPVVAQELNGLEKRLRYFHHLAGIIPLSAAFILLWIGPLPQVESNGLLFKGLFSLLLVSAVCGGAFSLRGLEELSATLGALTPSRKE